MSVLPAVAYDYILVYVAMHSYRLLPHIVDTILYECELIHIATYFCCMHTLTVGVCVYAYTRYIWSQVHELCSLDSHSPCLPIQGTNIVSADISMYEHCGV